MRRDDPNEPHCYDEFAHGRNELCWLHLSSNGVNLPAVDAHGAFINGVTSGVNFTITAYSRPGKLINATHPIYKNEQFGYSTTEYYPKPTIAYGFVRWTDPIIGGGAAWFDSAGNLNIVYSGFTGYTLVIERITPLPSVGIRTLQGGHGIVTWPGTCGTAAANLGILAGIEAALGGLAGAAGMIPGAGQAFGAAASQGLTIISGGTGVAAAAAAVTCPSSTTANGGILMSGPDVTDALNGLNPAGGTLVAGVDPPDGGGPGDAGSDEWLLC